MKRKFIPWNFIYIQTDDNDEYESGEIIENIQDKNFYIILTPSCDFIQRKSKGGKRKAEKHFISKSQSVKVGSINSIFYFLHKAAEPFNCLEQDNLA